MRVAHGRAVGGFVRGGRVAGGGDAVAIIRDRMNELGLTYDMLAIRSGVKKGTLSSYLRGRTKWPRDYTFFAIVYALDLEMRLVRR